MSTEIQNYSKGVNQSVLNSPQKPLALEWKIHTLKDPLKGTTHLKGPPRWVGLLRIGTGTHNNQGLQPENV